MEAFLLYFMIGLFIYRKEIKEYLKFEEDSEPSVDRNQRWLSEIRARLLFKILVWPVS